MKKESHKCALECDSKGSWKGKIPVPMVDHIFSFLKYLEEHHSLKGFCLENLRLVLIARNMIHLPSRHKDMKDLCFVVQELENTSWQ